MSCGGRACVLRGPLSTVAVVVVMEVEERSGTKNHDRGSALFGLGWSKTYVRMSALLWLGGCRLRMWRTEEDAVEPVLCTMLPPVKAEK